jgi:hypothetical protein
MFDDDEPMLVRLRELALAYPDADEKISHGAPAFFTTKVFAYYGGSEKLADGGHTRHDASLLVPTDPVDRAALLDDPRVYRPMYLGPSGWIGLRLDEETDWREVDELLETAYRLTAGVRRVRRLDERG